MRKIKKYGWIPSKKNDAKIFRLAEPMILPSSVDLRPNCPPVYDQGQYGSCTYHAWAAMIQYHQPSIFPFDDPSQFPSRRFGYYNETLVEGYPGQDNGAQLYDGAAVSNKYGVCKDSNCPYEDMSDFSTAPSKKSYEDAIKDIITDALSVPDLDSAKQCLAMGKPFVFGMDVYESFESPEVASTGIVPMPKKGEEVVGGHAVMGVGYDIEGRIIVRNSWGSDWGQAGYFILPVDYFNKYASDIWCLE